MRVGIALLLCLFVIGGCGKEKKSQAKVEEILTNVRVIVVEQKKAYEKLNLVGEIQGENEITVYPDIAVSGLIAKLKVDEGDKVKLNDPLMEIDQKAITGNDYRRFVVRARMAGTISQVYVQNGSLVSPQSKLCQIVQMNRLKVVIDIPERQIGKVHKGQVVYVQSQSYPGISFQGNITKLHPSVDPKTLTLRGEISLAKTDLKLKPGMFTQVEIVLKEKQAILIPLNALIIEDNVPYVYLYDESSQSVRQQVLRKGSYFGDWIEILEGLKVGDILVVKGQYQVTNKDKVRVVR